MHQHGVVLAGEGHQAFHEAQVDARGGGVVREGEDDDAWLGPRLLPRVHEPVEEGLARVGRAQRLDVGPAQGNLAHVGAGEERAPDVDRIGGRRHERGVARSDQDPHEMREALLGADRGDHLGVGVEVDVELALVEVGDGAAQLGDPARGRVAVVARVVRCLGQLAHRHVGRRQVGIAEPEVDHVASGSPRVRLQVVDGGEDVGRQPVDATELHRRSLRLQADRP